MSSHTHKYGVLVTIVFGAATADDITSFVTQRERDCYAAGALDVGDTMDFLFVAYLPEDVTDDSSRVDECFWEDSSCSHVASSLTKANVAALWAAHPKTKD